MMFMIQGYTAEWRCEQELAAEDLIFIFSKSAKFNLVGFLFGCFMGLFYLRLNGFVGSLLYLLKQWNKQTIMVYWVWIWRISDSSDREKINGVFHNQCKGLSRECWWSLEQMDNSVELVTESKVARMVNVVSSNQEHYNSQKNLKEYKVTMRIMWNGVIGYNSLISELILMETQCIYKIQSVQRYTRQRNVWKFLKPTIILGLTYALVHRMGAHGEGELRIFGCLKDFFRPKEFSYIYNCTSHKACSWGYRVVLLKRKNISNKIIKILSKATRIIRVSLSPNPSAHWSIIQIYLHESIKLEL